MTSADVKLSCGACGAAVAPGERACSGCGATLRFPDFRAGGGVRCPACGLMQSGTRGICESCGAALFPARKEKGARTRPRPSREPGKGTEPWMVVAGISVLLLLAYIIYTTVTAPAPPPSSSPSMPSGPAPFAAPRIDFQPLEEAVRRNPKDPAGLLKLANALHDGGLWDRAVETYEQYLTITPGDPDARVDMAICYFEASKANTAKREEYHARAESEMRRVLNDHPRHQPAAFNLGIVILHSGDVAGANEWFRRAAEIDPGSPLGQRATSILQQHTITK